MKIVVGIDGSDGGRAALHWALDEARAHGAALQVAYAWQMPTAASALGVPLQASSFEDVRQSAKAVLHDEIQMLGHDFDDVNLTAETFEGHPSDVLVAASSDADLLVVGCRGRGGLTSLVLGSVSRGCAHHARCPVVIVPPVLSISA